MDKGMTAVVILIAAVYVNPAGGQSKRHNSCGRPASVAAGSAAPVRFDVSRTVEQSGPYRSAVI